LILLKLFSRYPFSFLFFFFLFFFLFFFFFFFFLFFFFFFTFFFLFFLVVLICHPESVGFPCARQIFKRWFAFVDLVPVAAPPQVLSSPVFAACPSSYLRVLCKCPIFWQRAHVGNFKVVCAGLCFLFSSLLLRVNFPIMVTHEFFLIRTSTRLIFPSRLPFPTTVPSLTRGFQRYPLNSLFS